MKKLLSILLCVASVAMLTGCKKEMPDGTYTVYADEETTYNANGWSDYLILTYKDGEMVFCEYNAIDDRSQLKGELSFDEYPMDPLPSEWIKQLNENILATDNPSKVAAVAGATTSSKNVKTLYAAILENDWEENPDDLYIPLES